MTAWQPFARHSAKYYARRPSWNRQATICGEVAWKVAEERNRQREGGGNG